MPAKVKIDLSNTMKLPKEISKNFSRALKNEIGDEIIFEIISGKSPVRGHRFKNYSDAYANKKGRRAPVDMFETGKLLDSIKVKQIRGKGGVVIEFKDKKAFWHHNGEGRNPKRRLLPTDSKEKFNTRLTRLITNILQKAVKVSVRRV